MFTLANYSSSNVPLHFSRLSVLVTYDFLIAQYRINVYIINFNDVSDQRLETRRKHPVRFPAFFEALVAVRCKDFVGLCPILLLPLLPFSRSSPITSSTSSKYQRLLIPFFSRAHHQVAPQYANNFITATVFPTIVAAFLFESLSFTRLCPIDFFINLLNGVTLA